MNADALYPDPPSYRPERSPLESYLATFDDCDLRGVSVQEVWTSRPHYLLVGPNEGVYEGGAVAGSLHEWRWDGWTPARSATVADAWAQSPIAEG